jgi:hypothetical protein
MVMGDLYFIRLKHESSNKASARSTALNNIKYLPSKSTLKKEKKILLSQTPIRMGEMEVTNLMINFSHAIQKCIVENTVKCWKPLRVLVTKV